MLFNISKIFNEDFLNIFLFVLNIFFLFFFIFSLIYIRNSRKRWDKITDYLGDVTKAVDSVRYGNLTKKINKLDIANQILLCYTQISMLRQNISSKYMEVKTNVQS